MSQITYRSVSQEETRESDDELLDVGESDHQESGFGYGSGTPLTGALTFANGFQRLKNYVWSTKKRKYATTSVLIMIVVAFFILIVIAILSTDTRHKVHDPDTYHKNGMTLTTQGAI